MDCSEVREVLLARELGRLDHDEAAEVDKHVASCESCRALLEGANKVHRMLRAWRSATDVLFDQEELDGALAELAAERERRSARAEARRQAADEAAPPTSRRTKLALVGVAALVVVVALVYLLTRNGGAVKKDPILAALAGVTDLASARDVACVLDVQIIDQLTHASASEARLAARSWARTLARREGFAAAPAFVRAILGARAGVGAPPSGGAPDPLRLVGELELAGLAAWAEAECRRLLASAADEGTSRRAKLHLAGALLRQGKLDEAESVVTEIAPGASGPSPPSPGEPEAPEAPRGLIAHLAGILEMEIGGARSARAKLASYERPDPRYAHDRGGKIAIDAFEFDRAYELLAGKDPTCSAPLVAGWARLMLGELDEARKVLQSVAGGDARRYFRSVAHLGLSEIAFRQGRYYTGIGHLRQAREQRRSPEVTTRFLSVIAFTQGMRELIDYGSAPCARRALDEKELLDLKVREDLAALAAVHLRPRIEPLARARDAITRNWKREKTPFAGVVPPPEPGSVSGSKAATEVVKIDFDSGGPALEPANDATTVSDAGGREGRGATVESAGPLAAAGLTFEEAVPEVETWVACAVRLDSAGEFAIRAKEAGSGAVFRWRTFVLTPGRWHRLAVPLGAFEPEVTTGRVASGSASTATRRGRDASLLMKKIESVGFSFRPRTGEGPAAFVLDDVLVHHGEDLPEGVDDPSEPPDAP